MKKRGFTFVELLIVIAIIAILTAIGTVVYSGIKQKAYDAKVDVTLGQIEKAVRAYTTRGNAIRLRTYDVNRFYAEPTSGRIDNGVTVYQGGGLGRELARQGLLSSDLGESLKSNAPKRDLSLKNDIRLIHCGKSKLFVVIEAYSGTQESAFKDKISDLNCAWKTEIDWREENGLPSPSAWGTGGGVYRDQPYYKYAEIDL